MSLLWQNLLSEAIELRHDLHRWPEPGWQETRTAEVIRRFLTRHDIPWQVCAGTGTLARLNPSSSGRPHIALRSDIDALPITENTRKPYASNNAGFMHACGHDGHAATLLAAAAWLKQHEVQLPAPVTLVFQPAEEGGHGARHMIEEGALDGIDEIYGWHNWPAIPFGQLACPDDIVMCGNGTFRIRVAGEGGHASQPEQCRDPVLAACAIVVALQQITGRRLAPQQAAVVVATSVSAPSGPTIIPGCAEIGGSIRVPDLATRQQVTGWIDQISQQTAQAYGTTCEVIHEPRYEATINHASQAQRVRASWASVASSTDDHLPVRLPIMASEDFSYYLQRVPGAYALIGAGDDEPAHQVSCHSSYYDFNDGLIPVVVRYLARLVDAPVPPVASGI